MKEVSSIKGTGHTNNLSFLFGWNSAFDQIKVASDLQQMYSLFH